MKDISTFFSEQIKLTFDKIKNELIVPLLFKPLKQDVSNKILETSTDLALNLLTIFDKIIHQSFQSFDKNINKNISKLNLQFLNIKG